MLTERNISRQKECQAFSIIGYYLLIPDKLKAGSTNVKLRKGNASQVFRVLLLTLPLPSCAAIGKLLHSTNLSVKQMCPNTLHTKTKHCLMLGMKPLHQRCSLRAMSQSDTTPPSVNFLLSASKQICHVSLHQLVKMQQY